MDIPLLFSDKSIAVCLKPPGADSEKDMPALLVRQLHVPEVYCVGGLQLPLLLLPPLCPGRGLRRGLQLHR